MKHGWIRIRRLGFVLLGFLGLMAFGHAGQSQNVVNLPYSIFGIGELQSKTSSINRAMGGSGIAFRDEFNLNNINPASYNAIIPPITQVFELGFSTRFSEIDTEVLRESNTDGGLNNFNLWFRFSPNWAGTIGVSPYSTVSYNISDLEDFNGLSRATPVNYIGSGGLNQVYFGNAVNLTKNLSIGINAAFIFGSIDNTEKIENAGIVESFEVVNQITANKLNLDFGAQYTIPFKNERSLILGVVYDDPLTLKTNLTRSIFSTDTLAQFEDIDNFRLPEHIGLGVSFNTKKSTINLDWNFKEWSKANLNEAEELNNTHHIAAGYQYQADAFSKSYLKTLSFRGGFYVENYYLKVGGEVVNQWGLAAGIGLPIKGNRATLNLNYWFDQIGNLQDNLIKQNQHTIGFDITIRDIWFQKRKLY